MGGVLEENKGAEEHCGQPAFREECCPSWSSGVFARLAEVFESDLADDNE